LSGSTLTALSDKSGSGAVVNTFDGTSVTWAPNSVNNRPAFNLNSGRIKGAFSTTRPITLFTQTSFQVCVLDIKSSNSTFLAFKAGPNGSTYGFTALEFLFSQNTYTSRGMFVSSQSFPQIAAGAAGTPFLWTASYDGRANGRTIRNFLDGGGPLKQGSAAIATAPTNTPPNFLIGAQDTSNQWPGKFCEIIVFNRIVSDTERQEVERYLAVKWGFVGNLPVIHLYKSLPVVSRSFHPLDVADCGLMFDAADGSSVTGTNPVTAWANKGSIITTATVSSGTSTYNTDAIGRQFVSVPTGAALQFAATLNSSGSQGRTWFAVIRNTAQIPNGGALRITNPNTTGQGSLTINFVTATTYRISEGPRTSTGTTTERIAATVPNPLNVIEMYSVVNSFTPALNVITRNGTSLALTTSGQSATYATTNLTYTMPSTAVGCDYFELLFYTRDLEPNERLQIESYLARKWRLLDTIPNDHMFKSIPPMTPVFGPQRFSNLVRVWMDAADMSTITGTAQVTAWTNKGGNKTIATPRNGTFSSGNTTLNGMNFIQCPVGGTDMIVTGTPAGTRVSVFAVAKLNTVLVAPGTGMSYISGSPLNTSGNPSVQAQYQSPTATRVRIQAGAGLRMEATVDPSVINSLHILAISNDTVVARNIMTINGTPQTLTTSVAASGYRAQSTLFILGPIYDVSADVMEVCYFQGNAISPSDRQRIEGYLAHKWGLTGTLPASHPYKRFRP